MITIDNLKKTFGQFTAVDGITFSVGPGEVLGFLGPNGAGKSTTMKMISGFIKPTSGTVSVCGHDVLSDPVGAKKLLGYLSEGAPAYGEMTPAQFLSFIADIRQLKGNEKAVRIQHVVDKLALSSVMHRSFDTLSKGFRCRVGIAQAILHDPVVLILDEPTDGLDPNQKHQVRELISGLSEEKIVIISTHILEEVNAVCTRAIVIAGGRVLADASPSDLESRSRYHRAVTLSVPDVAPVDAIATFEQLSGVSCVEICPDKENCYTLLPSVGVDLLPAVNRLLQDKSWTALELYVERGRLDDVFRSLTQSKASEVVV
ncbi:MAG: ATP-binding cassette domain-containing protein [Endozoicomonadaceae bacterium]|nr:ATP-binding cassette domain-containing protein [Endozoicomonadaceae bacterium]